MVVLEVLRVLAIIAGGALFLSFILFLVSWPRHQMALSQKCRFVALFGFGIEGAIEEAQQLGKAFVWWRLPILLACMGFGLYGVYKPMVDANWRRRPMPPDSPNPIFDGRYYSEVGTQSANLKLIRPGFSGDSITWTSQAATTRAMPS